MKYLWLLAIAISTTGLKAQISFQRAGLEYTEGFRSGVAAMVTDINGDMLDDMVRFRDGLHMEVWLQGQEGLWHRTYGYTFPGDPQWNVTGADVDNDGWTDIVTSGAFDNVKVFNHNPFSDTFAMATLTGTPFFAQGSNLVDINNDGHLDIFVCNDVGESYIFINDSTGQFNRRSDIIDFTTDPPSDKSGNYGSVWSDFDSDGDLDLYIAKCRVGVGDPTDPRRVNVLYINEHGTFIDTAAGYGVATGRQSWSADLADIDNDGDLDLFVANHDVGSILYENVGNAYFEDITSACGISVGGLPIQSVFRDFDNDGWVDLLVGGTSSYLFHNNGDKTFSAVPDPFPGDPVISYALGDLNDDGFTDVYAIYNKLYNEPNDVVDDVIFLNSGNDNHYLRVVLQGAVCNRQGIGARLRVYGEWGVQIREVRAGESYGITNSSAVIFGLGAHATVDSLQVLWPHGLVETFLSPPVNTTVRIEEGGCITQRQDLQQGPYVQCASEAFDLEAPEGYTSYTWNNGDEGGLISAVTPGIYYVRMQDQAGCGHIGGPVLVAGNNEESEVEISRYRRDVFCAGDSVILTAPEGVAFVWNTGSMESSIVVRDTGQYSVTVTRNCSVVSVGPVRIEVRDPANFTFTPDTIESPGTGTLLASGDSINWYLHPGDDDPIHTGPQFTTPYLAASQTFYVENVNTIPGLPYTLGMKGHAGNTLYNADQFNGALIFSALNRFRLDSVLVITDFPGIRSVQILDAAEEVYYEESFFVEAGSSYLPLGVWLDSGEDYRITTNADTNISVFGTTSPQLVRSNALVDFPYVIEDVASITMTEFDNNFYYYFYDWHITSSDEYCYSQRYPVEVVVDSTSGVFEWGVTTPHIFPNPVKNTLHVNLPRGRFNTLQLWDGHGRIYNAAVSGGDVDVRHLPAGVYLIRISMEGQVLTGRFAKI